MATKWFDSKVVRIETESPATKRFWLKVQDVERFDFQAGQFVTMDLPLGEKRQQRWRSYSIANAPDGSNVLEFCIVHLEGGMGSRYFFKEVQVGSVIKFKGPDGTFVLPERIESDLVFVCTGTGVAPFRSMIQDVFLQKKPFKNIHLIFGSRYECDILYQQEFEELAQKMPGFRYSVALSREENVKVNGHACELTDGYVHPIYLKTYENRRPDVQFYLCGWSKMIDEAVANLMVNMGYDRTQVKYELYG